MAVFRTSLFTVLLEIEIILFMRAALLLAVLCALAVASAHDSECPDGECVDTDGASLIQMPRARAQQLVSTTMKTCIRVLEDLRESKNPISRDAMLEALCQESLPDGSCKDALALLGTSPWSDIAVSAACNMVQTRASLLQRSSLEASGASMEESLASKGEPASTTADNDTNVTSAPSRAPNGTWAPSGNSTVTPKKRPLNQPPATPVAKPAAKPVAKPLLPPHAPQPDGPPQPLSTTAVPASSEAPSDRPAPTDLPAGTTVEPAIPEIATTTAPDPSGGATAEPSAAPELATTAAPDPNEGTTTEPSAEPGIATTAAPDPSEGMTAEPSAAPEIATTAAPDPNEGTTAEPSAAPEMATTAAPDPNEGTTVEPSAPPEIATTAAPNPIEGTTVEPSGEPGIAETAAPDPNEGPETPS